MIEAIQQNDTKAKNFARRLRSKATESLLSRGLVPDTDDEPTYLKIVAVHRKSVAKALAGLEKNKKGGDDLAGECRFEIAFCDRLVPPIPGLELRSLVAKKIAELSAVGAGQLERVVRAVMDGARPDLETADVVRVARELLEQGAA